MVLKPVRGRLSRLGTAKRMSGAGAAEARFAGETVCTW